jgi:hypothetical protein
MEFVVEGFVIDFSVVQLSQFSSLTQCMDDP